MEAERPRLGIHVAPFHLADEDDVVAFVVAAAVVAFEPGHRAVQDRQAGTGQVERERLEAVADLLRKAQRQVGLLFAQYIDDVM